MTRFDEGAVIGVNLMAPTTRMEWREQFIADRLCPIGGCGGRLDDDFHCSMCGLVSLPAVGPAGEEDTEPGSLSPLGLGFPRPAEPLDEYSPCQVDEDEAV